MAKKINNRSIINNKKLTYEAISTPDGLTRLIKKNISTSKDGIDIIEANTSEPVAKQIANNSKKFLKDILKGAKEFYKKHNYNINKNAKKIMKELKKELTKTKNPRYFLPGSKLAFRYSAKYKEKTFDKKPLIICLGPPKNKKLRRTHTYGLNLHWLPVAERVTVAKYFLELRKKKNGKLTYKDVKPWLNRYKNSKVLRMYIIKNISNNIMVFPEDDKFLIATSLKTEKFIRGID